MILSLFQDCFLVCIEHIVLNWKMTGKYELGTLWKDIIMVYEYIMNYLRI
jgi:hypothetical protein